MQPSLHLICGMAGSGKTTLAKELEVSTQAIRLCPDEWIEPLLSTPNDRPEMDRLRPRIEELQWTLGQRLLSLGTNVILENGFWSRDERLDYLKIASALGAKVFLHYLKVQRDELIQRINRRNADIPAGSFFVHPSEIDTWLSWFVPPDETELCLYDTYKTYTT
ncbi:MAG: AAA family ATPase [Candidatus Latescibacteria bacterium]|nr:AAA family ATPase [Candidatus Latescibacterota bacterium]